jgi:hypothetical protein
MMAYFFVPVLGQTSAPTSITGTTTICSGSSTTLTASGGTLVANSVNVWYRGGYGGGAYDNGWDVSTVITGSYQSTTNNNTNGILNVTSTGGDPQFYMRSLGSFDPSVYKYINVRYRVTAGTAYQMQFFFLNTTYPNPDGGAYVNSGALNSDGNWHTISIDMSSAANWTTGGNITGWRFDWSVASGVTMDIDFIQLGLGIILDDAASIAVSPTTNTTYYLNRKGPAVSTASIFQLVTVNTLPTPTFTAQPGATACASTDVTYATQSGQTNYVWTLPGTVNADYTITSGGVGTTSNTVTLKWLTSGSKTVSINYTNSNSCTAASAKSSTATTLSATPTASNAGTDQTGSATCGLTSVTLAGNTPTVGTGAWSIVSGTGGSITTASSATSTFSGTAGSTYTLRWTISNSPCTGSTDDVVITFNQNPTTANAGADQNVASSGGAITATLAGNLPSIGTGLWTIESGTGGKITSPTNPTSTFAGTAGVGYVLRWMISNSPCNASTDEMIIASEFSWTGSGGDDIWGNGNNWSSGTAPSAGVEIVISSGNPKLNTDYAVGGSLTLSGTATLTVDAGKTLSIAAGGVADFGGKLVTFKSDATGTGQMGIVAGTLSGATNVLVERHIPALKRAFRFFGSPVTTITTIGQNWMEGATPGVLAGYPYRTASVYNPNLGYGTLITGAGGNANGFDASQTNNPSLFTFNNSTGAWVTATNTTGTIAAGSAYRLFVRGDRSYGITASTEPIGGSTILRTTGTIAQGQLTTGTGLPALSQAASGWSLVGNPYQSVVDMASADLVKNNITNYYYIWDPNMATRGAYVAFNLDPLVLSSNYVLSDMNRYAQPGQAFFVQNTTAGSNSIVFKETAKGAVSKQTATFARNNTTAGTENGYTTEATTKKGETIQTAEEVNYASLSVLLYYKDSLTTGAAVTDATRVLFGSQFSNLVDANDGRKFTNLDETMAIKQGTSLLSMELRSLPDSSTKLPLSITQYVDKKYTMRLLWDEKLNNDTLVAYLRDKYTNKETAINKTGNTDVEYLLDADAKSSAVDRFEIFFKSTSNQVTAVINYDNGQYIKLYPNPVQSVLNIDFELGQNKLLDMKVYDMAGRLAIERKAARTGAKVSLISLAKGTYNVQVWGADGKLLMSDKIIKD